ncbi:MAG: SpoIIE family protein phosphatase [Planctomycetia bacterium]|nr:SpoIIE family protein phosphatase [Planctomycetia bacterium]
MQKIFRFWLFVFVATAFLITFSLSFYTQTQQAESNATQMIALKIKDIKTEILQSEKNANMQEQFIREQALARVRALARLIQENPKVLQDRAQMEGIRKDLDINEYHISDEKGILICSEPQNHEGYDMNSQAQSREFMEAITNPDFAYVQLVRAKGINGNLCQYAGVARRDKPGIVQIGFQPERYYKAMKITSIENFAAGFRIGQEGRLLVARDGVIVSVDDPQWLGKTLEEYGIPMGAISELRGEFDLNPGTMNEKKCYYEKFRGFLLIGSLPDVEVFVNRNQLAIRLILFNLVLFVTVFVLVSLLVDRVVIRGIFRVNRSLEKITEGDLNEVVNVRNNPEFSELSDGINSMVNALKKAIAKEAARIDGELELARSIQKASLPNVFPPFPERQERFDLYATMDTAKKVGGDFYDFFLVDDDHLVVLVADVSGKGIPAALFMMTAKSQIKNLARTRVSPAEIFNRANHYLCENNDTGMFVTAFLAVLEISTGKLTWTNAGHLPPLWYKKSTGSYNFLSVRNHSSFVLAAIDGMDYDQQEITLSPGDRFFLYTDGVTEAVNPQKQLYRDDRLQDVLNSEAGKGLSLAETLKFVRDDIRAYAEGAEQSDDITMLVLERRS